MHGITDSPIIGSRILLAKDEQQQTKRGGVARFAFKSKAAKTNKRPAKVPAYSSKLENSTSSPY